MNAKILSKMLSLMLANRESKSYNKPWEITRIEFENWKPVDIGYYGY